MKTSDILHLSPVPRGSDDKVYSAKATGLAECEVPCDAIEVADAIQKMVRDRLRPKE